MVKAFAISALILASLAAFGQHKDKDTVTHAVNHAGNWVSSHVNAPHKHLVRRRRHRHYRRKPDTVTHAVNHAGNWISHHVNAPHH